MSGESSRPWEPTHEEVEEHGVWADYAAFGRWWQDAVEETLCEGEASIWDGMGTIQQTHMYVVLSSLFDARPPGPATGFSSAAADRVDEQAAHIGSLEAKAPERWQAVLGTTRYWLQRAAQTIRDREQAARTPGPATAGGIVEGLAALREAGGKDWDAIPDPAEYLGRKEPDVSRLLAALEEARRIVHIMSLGGVTCRGDSRQVLGEIDAAVAEHEAASKGAAS